MYQNIDMCLQRKIQKVQDMCCRFIFDIKKSESVDYVELRTKLGWLSMKQRRDLHCLTMLYKILHDSARNISKICLLISMKFIVLTQEVAKII